MLIPHKIGRLACTINSIVRLNCKHTKAFTRSLQSTCCLDTFFTRTCTCRSSGYINVKTYSLLLGYHLRGGGGLRCWLQHILVT